MLAPGRARIESPDVAHDIGLVSGYDRLVRIRTANRDDADAIRAIVFPVLVEYGPTPDPGGVDADLDDVVLAYHSRGGMFDVLETEQGTIVGTVGLAPTRPGVCELRKMYLQREQRGLGFGKRLLDHALTRARELGFGRVELETLSSMVEARGLYRDRGFVPFDAPHAASRCDIWLALEI